MAADSSKMAIKGLEGGSIFQTARSLVVQRDEGHPHLKSVGSISENPAVSF